jgi:endogenous inhibitor of DNA gyrase (YacG/DUF329 family)
MPKCPICDAAAKPRGENASFPFCSARCKMVDLGKWMNEEYRVPAEELDDDDLSDAVSDGLSKTDEDMRH